MADQTVEQRKSDLIAAMSEERGYMPAPWAYMAERDLDFIEAYNNLYTRGLSNGDALPIKTRELICIGILAFRGHVDAVYEHAKRALRNGATKRELLEAIETMIIPGGAPTFGTGLRALMRIEEEQKAGNKQ
ncbi:MAG: carboxymuconolactone decarboxylase family protein [Candidatus Micrarchaeaceae archaeon]